ncbi:MAG: FAD-dependent thymidylate synthase [bacterium]
MKVVLINHTPKPLKTVYTAARTCYSPDSPSNIFTDEIAFEKMTRLLDKVIDAGHHSVLEHISFTFAIEGISRTCSHQLVRHRIASFSQQSQRYVESGPEGTVRPGTIEFNDNAREIFDDIIRQSGEIYSELTEMDIPAEDARFVLPNACTTNIVMTMNFRELMTTCGIRLCTRAQWEIRELFHHIVSEMKKVDEMSGLAKYLVPKCDILGYCPEMHSCGRRPTKAEIFNAYERRNDE